MSNGSPADPGLPDVTPAAENRSPPTEVAGPADAPDAVEGCSLPSEHPPGETAPAYTAAPNCSPPTEVADPADAPAVQMDPVRLWERQPGETAQAFAAARKYFQLGADRSLTGVACSVQKDRSLAGRWSREWRWVARAAAYDQHMARVEQEAREKECAAQAIRWEGRRDALRERAWDTAETLFSLVDRALKEEVNYSQDMKVADLLRVLDRANELARFAVGVTPPRPVPGDPWGKGNAARDPGGGAGSGEDGPRAAAGGVEDRNPSGKHPHG